MLIEVEVTQEDIARGVRWNTMFCPISLAIQRRTGESRVHVYTGESRVHVYRDSVDVGHHHLLLPTKARRFVTDFDRGTPRKPLKFTIRDSEVA